MKQLTALLGVPLVAASLVCASTLASPSKKYAYTNRLIGEKSPYLRLHAHNPVDWYPWGGEAFEKARRENKPIFLSVGYYTCHWCHVMEREDFSDPKVAQLINRWFVAIKVDREERPDIDATYIAFVEATTGSAGWPMTVFLTPDGKPFFGGTFFPPEDRYGQTGLKSLLPRMAEAWGKQHEEVLKSAAEITRQLQEANRGTSGNGFLPPAALDTAYEQIRAGYDKQNGGFGPAPKFPRPVALEYLLRYWVRTGKPEALDMTLETLRALAAGGVHDQLGGGFHRYSTDARWRVPHFEKMLYDQAQLAQIYIAAYQITHDVFFATVARDILDFTLREMRDPQGGFDSALDADSPAPNGKPSEGAFYVWTASEIERVLGKDTAAIFSFAYGVGSEGNVPQRQDVEGQLRGQNVLYKAHTIREMAAKFGKSEAEIGSRLDAARQKLLAVRAQRKRPPADTKVITSWNGMMISALARASQALEEPRYLEAAKRTAAFLRARMYSSSSGALKRRYRAGSVAIDGYLDDYASFIQGLLDLYEASFDLKFIECAFKAQTRQDALFWDHPKGGYFVTSGQDSSILLRTRQSYDGAEPSPNSVAAMNLLRLWQFTDQQSWKDKADKTIAVFSDQLSRQPESMPYLMSAFAFDQSKHKQIVIAGMPGAADTRALLHLVGQRYLPNRILLLADGGERQKQWARWLPLLATVTRKQGHATAYVCENYICNLPSADPEVVAKLLDPKK
jgi:uncharacterized protein